MLRLPVFITLFLGCIISTATCAAAGQQAKPDDKSAWQESELKRFQGRWTAYREEKSDQAEIQRRWVDLEFAEGELKVSVLDEKRKRIWEGPPLKVVSVEQGEALGLAAPESRTCTALLRLCR